MNIRAGLSHHTRDFSETTTQQCGARTFKMVLERNKYIIRSTTERHGEQKMACVNHQKKGLSCAVHVQVYEIKIRIYSHFFFFFWKFLRAFDLYTS